MLEITNLQSEIMEIIKRNPHCQKKPKTKLPGHAKKQTQMQMEIQG